MSRRHLLAAIILVATLAAYIPALRAGFIWDDPDYVTQNRTLLSYEGLRDIWLKPAATPQYYPLVHTSFWIERRVWGLNPHGFHLDNVLLHFITALLIWRLCERLKLPGGPLAAVLFALHPVNVETVAWVTERKNVLCAMFSVLTVIAYLDFRPLEEDRPRWHLYWRVVLFFVLAMFSKTIACTIPPILLILIWWKRGRLDRADGWALAPLFLIGAALGAVTVHLEQVKVGAVGESWSLSFAGRVMLAGRIAWFYLVKALWPHPLIFIYPRWNIDAGHWAGYWFPASICIIGIVLWWLRDRLGRGPFVVYAAYLLALFPAMGFFNVFPMRYSYVADHFAYLAMIPLVIGLGVLIARALPPRAACAVTALIGMAYALVVVQHGHDFHDEETLWRRTLAKNSDAEIAAHNLGVILAERKEYDEAIHLYEHALKLNPKSAADLNQLAVAYIGKGDRERGMAFFDQALAVEPEYAPALINLSGDAMVQGNPQAAEDYARRAVRSAPRGAMGYVRLGRALTVQRRYDEAINTLRTAVELEPGLVVARYSLAIALGESGRTEDAIEQLRLTLAENPNNEDIRQSLVQLLRAAGRDADARMVELGL